MASRLKYYAAIGICLIVITSLLASFGDIGKAGNRLIEARKKLSQAQAEKQVLWKQKAEADRPEYFERIARDRLGMAKPGETVIILPESLKQTDAKLAAKEEPNWQKWLKVFF